MGTLYLAAIVAPWLVVLVIDAALRCSSSTWDRSPEDK